MAELHILFFVVGAIAFGVAVSLVFYLVQLGYLAVKRLAIAMHAR